MSPPLSRRSSRQRRVERQIAIFGGSFDPPHLGHVLATQYLLTLKDMAAVWWLPCWQHRFDKSLTPFAQRLQMCRLATKSFSRARVRVLDFERRISADGKTLNVLRALRRHYPGKRFVLAVGSDIVRTKSRWWRFTTIERQFGVVVVPRGGKRGIPNIRSRDLRQFFKSHSPAAAQLLPAEVENYLRRRRLYSNQKIR